MKLRTQLILSYLCIVVLIISGLTLIFNMTLQELRERDLHAAEDAIEGITRENYHLSEKILTAYGERIVQMKADSVAKNLSLRLGGQVAYDYTVLRENEELRKIATQDIRTWDGIAGYVDVLDNQGFSVWHPNRSVEGRNFSEWRKEFPDMWKLVERSFTEKEVKGYYTFIDRNNKVRKKYLTLAQVPDTPFIACAVVNIDQYFLPVHKRIETAGHEMVKKAGQDIRQSSKRAESRLRKTILLSGTAALCIGILFGLWFSNSISRPILRLRDGVTEIGKGNFSVQAEAKGSRETVQLAESFNLLGKQLVEYMENLKNETAARQAVESEIMIARRIQESLLPRTFPPFPDRKEFHLHAVNVPAREVGGDFFDFFFVTEDRLALIIADVSGKGIPAALFMAVSRTILKNICTQEQDPAQALDKANFVLCQDNDACMFVTLFLAYFDVKTGRLLYANAGHNGPLLLKPDGSCESFGLLKNMALGIEEEYPYQRGEKQLAGGETLIFYTDGITEALSPQGELFGEKRFVQLLKKHRGLPLVDMTERIVEALGEYQKGHQFDDITLMLLRREEVA